IVHPDDAPKARATWLHEILPAAKPGEFEVRLRRYDGEYRWFMVRVEPVNQRYSPRSEEHTSELQSRFDLVCRLLLEKQQDDAKTGITVPLDTKTERALAIKLFKDIETDIVRGAVVREGTGIDGRDIKSVRSIDAQVR